MLEDNLESGGLALEGLSFEGIYTGTAIEPSIQFDMNFLWCYYTNFSLWYENATPKLIIYGKKINIDTIKTTQYNSGTIVYSYDDKGDSVTVSTKIDKPSANRYKKISYRFDRFGKPTETRLYTGTFSNNLSNTYYNYLDAKGKSIDPVGNQTKLSYDKYGGLSKTQHADDSVTLISQSFQTSLQTEYYNFSSGFISKQIFTDETKRTFIKYFDAAGNLLREEKSVAGNGSGQPQQSDNPFDPDTTYEGQDAPSQTVSLITDYKYDDLYRVIEVKTPNSKLIKYQYDALGRPSQRETSDAGITKYWYNKNDNITFSQDVKQRNESTEKYTLRTYDGLKRLLTISEETPNDPEVEEDNPTPGNAFIVNCYDSLIYTPLSGIFTNIPTDYNSEINNTKGELVATAYKTNLTDGWSYKFYRYDARGRVIKFWHYINGLGWKTENYYLNSSNQVARNWYQPSESDGKVFVYNYDDAGRLANTKLYVGTNPGNPSEEEDGPLPFLTLTSYTYNENSQISTHNLNLDQHTNTYAYNNRNWIQSMNTGSGHIFKYILLYNPNGNIRYQSLEGTYNNSFSDQDDYRVLYTYDQSNRLTFAEYKNPSGNLKGKVINGFDKDGNLMMLKRNDPLNSSIDDFSYSYYSGTNKLKKVSGSTDQYTYDDNGNMTNDELNRNYNVLYDYRNLMTDIRTIRQEAGGGPVPQDVTYWTVYKYDETGNRVRKSTYKYTGSSPEPIYNDGGDNPSWETVSDEYYVRDISGKEIANYSSTSLQFWNIWGLDNVGKINSDTTKNYYLKDHLGSVHAEINSTNTVISAQDYDVWGYLLPNRSYNINSMKYDYTSKEHDNETNYDYFGARYYDSRIARWGQNEPLLEKYVSYSPYIYTLSNPLRFIDIDGKDGDIEINEAKEEIKITVTFHYSKYSKDNPKG
jgi:RHS repeat-associated protein